MSTVVAVRKNNKICIAADTLTSFGSNKKSAVYDKYPNKIVSVGEKMYLGLVGSAAHNLVIESALAKEKKLPELHSRLVIFDFFRKLHRKLKNDYFLNPKEEEDDPYESSQMELLMINRYGLFGVYSLREVFEYRKFWAIGSGSEYALGAMYALYDQLDSASAIAEIGVKAGIEFDDGSAEPIDCYSLRLSQEDI